MAGTVKNPVLEVYERWKNAVEPITGKGNCPMSKKKTVAKFKKFARIFMLGNPTYRSDLEGDECATMLSFQIDCFASGQKALSAVYEVDKISHESMVGMGFRRTYGPEPIEEPDSTIQRLTSRYTRVYAGSLLGGKKNMCY